MANTIVDCFVTCAKHLEGLLAEEIQSLGGREVKETVAGVTFKAAMLDVYRICMWSRLANRVLLPMVQGKVERADDLYALVQQVPWEDHLSPTGTLAVDFSGSSNAIRHTRFGTQTVKDAIVDLLRTKTGKRPTVQLKQPDLRVNAYLKRDHVIIALDLSGDSLHQRGYRLQAGTAPLKETLAAGVLYRLGWPNRWQEYPVLIDPMCGAGTLVIEAAHMAMDRAPALNRQYFGFNRWYGHTPLHWREIVAEAQDRFAAGLERELPEFIGLETNQATLKAACNNIQRAGLQDKVQIKHQDLSTLPQVIGNLGKGFLVTNPPYGERLGEDATLLYLYQNLGTQLREHCMGWDAGLITGNPELAKRMGLRAKRQYSFYNGALPCKLLTFDVSPEYVVKAHKHAEGQTQSSREAYVEAPVSAGATMFANRLRKNIKKLKPWLKQQNVDCYRIYDADMPEYAFAIDRYADWLHVQEYAPPASVDPERAQQRLLDALSVLPDVTGVASNQIVLKQRRKQKGTQQYKQHDQTGDFFPVTEYQARFLVNLKDYLDTGLFLDHRPMRRQIFAEARGLRVLNLYCYTASVSVHAALGGAASTTSVDLSPTYIGWATKNFALNGLGEQHQLVQADCLKWLEQNHTQYDLIFIDPPTFSNSKRTEQDFDIQRDHEKLLTLAMSRLNKKGTLYFSNNFRRFKFADQLLYRFEVEELSSKTIDPDFARNPKIHRCWRLCHRN
ncbi:bifunctional 23S rRNA (guanine(2069)-N(7))-methyltransferase RlmK/23S rRNA (guanine(2445)-N(2))-methyltransferase RlmL [Zooshikella marina]|uniref:bifunctional 23S rRNA (guanine(2069)-N(7))-methyltransferase RlmK/23S rRNA (guanine(2445)-N(2))-methyltransferase RlmL n=1 Tax=Zooshikella ganghwensis TaxID=202772 RepID=UPI001BAE97C2|nr:bifunctional 23S rRNA (guanine(2069)-N(7))-methyltransferase RlmK/23S rRNA (guanine(2445)-N(2))-methyltransferase RlmL [Zooshikella ganghwensis]MBU2704371.1 bifunctional 23S rRNA (guanine(2069)-N(7))-methyltransferase RlmK/23S rRNA (guanine(2445)-N(2))-methyltransferase RlmL [Zooshikella ganghwensis]